jgi:hypothetical protein
MKFGSSDEFMRVFKLLMDLEKKLKMKNLLVGRFQPTAQHNGPEAHSARQAERS